MPKSQYVDFKSVKASVTMEQVFQHHGLLEQMKRSGDGLSGCCPLHGGTNVTQFRVSISKNCWNCFSECKSGGNVLDFVAKKEHITGHAAATKLCEWFQLPIEDHRTAAPNKLPKPQASPKPASGSPIPTVVEERHKPEDEMSNSPLKFRLEHLDATHSYLAELERLRSSGMARAARS
jgi:DNA primase